MCGRGGGRGGGGGGGGMEMGERGKRVMIMMMCFAG
jgi:hypothetical protein